MQEKSFFPQNISIITRIEQTRQVTAINQITYNVSIVYNEMLVTDNNRYKNR